MYKNVHSNNNNQGQVVQQIFGGICVTFENYITKEE